jgi:hypothetical protein
VCNGGDLRLQLLHHRYRMATVDDVCSFVRLFVLFDCLFVRCTREE